MRIVRQERPANGRAEADISPFAIIDVGSNSIRLVVYRSLSRAPLQLFNEKSLCGLARGMVETGKLHEAGVECALGALERYCRIARGFGADAIDIVATAAVRHAQNGPKFVQRARKITGLPVNVLTGDDEARFTAAGVALSFHEPKGIVGDLGGGSIELASINKRGAKGPVLSLELGSLTLAEALEASPAKADKLIEKAFEPAAGFKGAARGMDFFVVGGAWRALARIRLAMTGAPLRVVHGYFLTPEQTATIGSAFKGLSDDEIAALPGTPSSRVSVVQAAARLLDHTVALLEPDRVVFSAFGLREGRLFSQLSSSAQARDPLLEGTSDIARRDSRLPDIGKALIEWSASIFKKEPAAEYRLRAAACFLSDIGWQNHPGSRPRETFFHVAQLSLAGIVHRERAFLAYTLFIRYEGEVNDTAIGPIRGLLAEGEVRRAEQLGLALNLAFRFSGGVPDILKRSKIKIKTDRLNLYLSRGDASPADDSIKKRLKRLASALDLDKSKIKPFKD